MMRHWREREFEGRYSAPAVRRNLRLWAWLVRHPALYDRVIALAARSLRLLAGRRGRLSRLPLAGGWTVSRDLPAPEGSSFKALWAAGVHLGRGR